MAETSSAQRAYDIAKEQILSGGVRGGQLLSEVEMAAQLGISRTPVHEAFLRLAAEDLLELLPRRGAVVVPISAHDATDVLEMRLALETAAVRRLCRSADVVDALLTDLTALIAQQRETAAAGDVHEFAAADDAFHRCIVDVAGNAIAHRFYCSISERQRRMMADAARSESSRLAALVDERDELATAIGARDLTRFEAALVGHLEATYRVTIG